MVFSRPSTSGARTLSMNESSPAMNQQSSISLRSFSRRATSSWSAASESEMPIRAMTPRPREAESTVAR